MALYVSPFIFKLFLVVLRVRTNEHIDFVFFIQIDEWSTNVNILLLATFVAADSFQYDSLKIHSSSKFLLPLL